MSKGARTLAAIVIVTTAAACGSRTGVERAEGGPTANSGSFDGGYSDGGIWGPDTGPASDSGEVDYGGDAEEATDCNGVSCEGTCTAGRCLVTLARQPGFGLTLHGSDLVWIAYDVDTPQVAGNVMKVSVDGGSAVTLASNVRGSQWITVGGETAYWTSVVNPGRVLGVPLGGGAVSTIATLASPGAIVADTANVYWTGLASVMAAPLDGGNAVTLAASPTLEYSNQGRIAIDSTSIYFGVFDDSVRGAIVSVPLAGGAATTLASGYRPVSVAVDAVNIYWADERGNIYRLPRSGGTPTAIAADQGGPLDIAVDDANVYWTDTAAGAVVSVPIAGGVPTTLATGQTNAAGVAVDGSSLYWACTTAIMKLTPK